MVDGDVAAQTHRVFKNLGAILAAAGASFDNVVRTTVYLADMNDFPAMNEIYATYFSSPAPARATVQAARLPRDARVEIDLDRYAVGRLRADGLSAPDFELRSSLTALTAPRARRRPHPRPTSQRLDHLLQVLHVADLDRHVDAAHLVESTVASTLRMLVLMPAIFELTSARMPLRSST